MSPDGIIKLVIISVSALGYSILSYCKQYRLDTTALEMASVLLHFSQIEVAEVIDT